jgi:hypothetical protein
MTPKMIASRTVIIFGAVMEHLMNVASVTMTRIIIVLKTVIIFGAVAPTLTNVVFAMMT